MDEKYEVNDFFSSRGAIARITQITSDTVAYRWLGNGGHPSYDFEISRKLFEKALREKIYVSCSEREKLSFSIKYS
jgi:hypothetical protein